jgi:hypothetical protein
MLEFQDALQQSTLLVPPDSHSQFWQTLRPRTSIRFATQDWPARSPDLTTLGQILVVAEEGYAIMQLLQSIEES